MKKEPRFKAVLLGVYRVYDYEKFDVVQENGVFLEFPNLSQAIEKATELNRKDFIEKEEARLKEELPDEFGIIRAKIDPEIIT